MEKVDEFKSKLLNLIQGNAKVPVVGHLQDHDQFLEEIYSNDPSALAESLERPSDQEILETIDKKYFSIGKNFDPGRYGLDQIEDMRKIEKIEDYLHLLKQQQLVVSNNVLQMILEKQSCCKDEFNNVEDVAAYVDNALENVRECRNKLELATRHFITASLGILSNYRKRILVQQLLKYLRAIKSIYETESIAPGLFKSGDYFGAISLLTECQKVAAINRDFSCVVALSAKLKDTLVMAEEHLDGALSTMCYEFKDFVYGKLQAAYAHLDKTEVAIDQLLMHFMSAVQKTSSKVVQCHAVIDVSTSNDKIQYNQLCKDVPEEHFIPCLLSLCKALWKIIFSYHHVVIWHTRNNQENTGNVNFVKNYNEQYVKNRLKSGLAKLWQDVQTKVSSLVMASNLSNYKIDDFLKVLSILHRLSQIGEELCDSQSTEVADSVRTQSICYFKKFHADKLDDLKVFLENEAWTPCPVKKNFSLLHLPEFRGLRSTVEQCAGVSGRNNSNSIDGSSTGANFFNRFPDPKVATPFDLTFNYDLKDETFLEKNTESEEMAGSYSEESEEDDVHLSSVSMNTDTNFKDSFGSPSDPLFTNTALSVLRLCGKYLQMSRLLKSISVEVVTALTQLFEYYLYTVHSFFASDTPNSLCPNVSSLKMISVIKRIKKGLFQNEILDLDVPIDEALLSPMIDLLNPDNLYGLKERVVAVESLIFLTQEFKLLRSYLEQLLESQGASVHCLQQLYNQTVPVALEMRKPIFACVAWRSIDSKQALGMMSKVNWEDKDVTTDHSKYVDFIFQELQHFQTGISTLSSTIPIPETSLQVLWECLIMLIAYIFVEGFAGSKKCGSGGRGQMKLDFTMYVCKLEKICSIRPIPYKEFVDAYICAYYLTDEHLENWIKQHREYNSKQLTAVVCCTCVSNRKMRQKLIALVDELEKERQMIAVPVN